MMRFSAIGTALVGALLSLPTLAQAQSVPTWLSEVRLGVMDHNPFWPEHGTVDIDGEMLFAPWTGPGTSAWVPRLDLGAAINASGKTSQVYGGFVWDVPLSDRFFLEGGFGAAANNGDRDHARPGHANVGCNFMFHESAGVGYRIDKHWTALLDATHTSNAGLCLDNGGITDFGLKIGYAF